MLFLHIQSQVLQKKNYTLIRLSQLPIYSSIFSRAFLLYGFQYLFEVKGKENCKKGVDFT